MRRTTRLLATGLALAGLLGADLGAANADERVRTKRVTRYNVESQGWERIVEGGASADFAETHGGSAGDGALVLSSPGGRTASAELVRSASTGTTLDGIEHLAFSTYVVTPDSGAVETPTIRMSVREAATSLVTGEVVFRPSVARAGTVSYDRWQDWAATEAPKGWYVEGAMATARCASAASSCSYGEVLDELGGDTVVVDHRVSLGPISSARTVAVDSVLIDLMGADGILWDLELDQPVSTDGRAATALSLDLRTPDGDVLEVDALGAYNVDQLRAVLTDASGRPLGGETVSFVRVDATFVRQELCRAVTEANGMASCRVLDGVRPALADHRVQARFGGDRDRLQPAYDGTVATFTVG